MDRAVLWHNEAKGIADEIPGLVSYGNDNLVKCLTMTRPTHVARLLALLLVLAVVFAPVASAFAFAVEAGNAHTVHASHDCDHPADESGQAEHHQSTCTQHDACAGQCCSCCVQCLNAAIFTPMTHVPSHPVQTPISSQLHSLVVITSLDRPPRSFSL